jgi:hypothetical protein
VAIQENKKHRIEYGNLDIQLDQGGQTIDGFSEVERLRVEVHIFDFGVGTHHGVLAPESDREHSIQNQMAALNVGFVDRLRCSMYGVTIQSETHAKLQTLAEVPAAAFAQLRA